MSFLNLENKNILVTGVANKKSVAWYIAKTLEEEGANVIYSVRSEDRKKLVVYPPFRHDKHMTLDSEPHDQRQKSVV